MTEREKYSDYLAQLRTDYTKVAKAEFMQPDGSVAFALDNNIKNRRSGAFIQDGTFTCNRQNGQRRKMNLKLSNIDAEFDYNINKIWFGTEIRYSEGLILSDGVTPYHLPQGVLLIENPVGTFEPANKTMDYPLADKWANLDGTLFGNLDGTYTVPKGTNIFKAIRDLLRLDKYTAQYSGSNFIDPVPPYFTDYYNNKTQTLTDGSVVPLIETPYTYSCDSTDGTIADVILALVSMLAADVGYDQTGRFRLDPSQDDIQDTNKPILWNFTPTKQQLLSASYTTKNTEIYNDIIVVGESLDDYGAARGRAQNRDPRSDVNIYSKLGLRTKRIPMSGYYANSLCRDYAAQYIKRHSTMQKAISIPSTQLFHIYDNGLVTVQRTDKIGSPIESCLITGFSRPVSQKGAMTTNTTSVYGYVETTLVYQVSYSLTNLMTAGLSSATDDGPFTTVLTSISGYALPDSVTVEMGNTTLTPGTDYTYNNTTGKIVIASISDDVTITASGTVMYSITYVLTYINLEEGPGSVKSGSTLSASISSDAGIRLPNTIVVTMGGTTLTPGTDYTYNNTTGVISIAAITAAIIITAVGDATVMAINNTSGVSVSATLNIYKADATATNIYFNGTLLTSSTTSGTQDIAVTLPMGESSITLYGGEWYFDDYCLGGSTNNAYLTNISFNSDYGTIIGASAFVNCTSLAIESLPNNITSIGDYAFWGCTNLALAALPSSLVSIGITSFANCINLELTSLPSGLTSIGDVAFSNCVLLALTALPSGLTSIGSNAFTGCTKLALTSLPSGLTAIATATFERCPKLALISLPSNVTSIGNYAFEECGNLALTTLPSGLASIGIYAFYACEKLAITSLPSAITSITKRPFSECKSLISISLPSGLTSIEDYAFYLCSNLATINYDGTTTQWASVTKGTQWASYIGTTYVTCTNGTVLI